jgi:cellulose synthase/poly-beta-1,6-N-acetylglucosamine synthase-like glycosyltransferase
VHAVPDRIYVDSGSADDSAELARSSGTEVLQLTAPPPFTAARGRNAGLARLLVTYPQLQFVQMVDGDCELHEGWMQTALAAMRLDPSVAAVFGRTRERNPQHSIYNALCDDEWNVPVGEAEGCGGNAFFRVAALRQVNFYNASMIAGEDTELSMRLRKAGWRLLRIDAEMTVHDAEMTRFRQWWRRTRRSGHAYAEMAHLHPDARAPNWPRIVRSIAVWGGVNPVGLLFTVALALGMDRRWWLATAALVIAWPFKMVQITRRQQRRGLSPNVALASGVLLMVGKVPQVLGLIGYHLDRLWGRSSHLIEHR